MLFPCTIARLLSTLQLAGVILRGQQSTCAECLFAWPDVGGCDGWLAPPGSGMKSHDDVLSFLHQAECPHQKHACGVVLWCAVDLVDLAPFEKPSTAIHACTHKRMGVMICLALWGHTADLAAVST